MQNKDSFYLHVATFNEKKIINMLKKCLDNYCNYKKVSDKQKEWFHYCNYKKVSEKKTMI